MAKMDLGVKRVIKASEGILVSRVPREKWDSKVRMDAQVKVVLSGKSGTVVPVEVQENKEQVELRDTREQPESPDRKERKVSEEVVGVLVTQESWEATENLE